MYKKMLISFIIFTICVFSFSLCFANDSQNMLEDASNSAKNTIKGAENTIGDTAKNITEGIENGTKDTADSIMDNTKNAVNNTYVATRTSADVTNGTFMGMNATAWTWLIMAILGVLIVAMVWYYAKQKNSSNIDDNRY